MDIKLFSHSGPSENPEFSFKHPVHSAKFYVCIISHGHKTNENTKLIFYETCMNLQTFEVQENNCVFLVQDGTD